MFKKILIANRGEIAIRIMRCCREMGIPSVSVYSEIDREALHVRLADEAYCIGPASPAKSYLNIDNIVSTAKKAGADAVHPGYGFLAENADFARRCLKEGLVFIGPSAEAMEAMGSKIVSRKIMSDAGVPVIPGTFDALESLEDLKKQAKKLGFPILLKASAGGGGKGMRLVKEESELSSAFRATQSEALSSFGNATVYLEKYLESPHHIEFQVLADSHGNTIHLGERECSIQRRHQKVIEETPSPFLDEELRGKMAVQAICVAQAVDYVNAGTVEFMVDKHKHFYFLEMNTRLQVEHPITEMVTGIDLVKSQINIAAGLPLEYKQEDVTNRGAAIECRIYAEDTANSFLPSPGKIAILREPSGPGIRLDSGIFEGYEVPVHYDPLLAKLIAWGRNRKEAIDRMRRALKEYRISGIKSNISAHLSVMEVDDFLNGTYDTSYVDRHFLPIRFKVDTSLHQVALIGASIFAYDAKNSYSNNSAKVSGESKWKLAGRQRAFSQRR